MTELRSVTGRFGEAESAARKYFQIDQQQGIALVSFDDPTSPVNTLSPQVGEEFDRLLTAFGRDDTVKAVVFTSGKKDSFVAGVKIELLTALQSAAEGEALARYGQAVFGRLERFPKPVVAAIHGACLGGGLEWILACHYRVATDHSATQLGPLETRLGVIPGAGGTQRLPRLIGIQAALDLILAGRRVKVETALDLGLVDEVVPLPLLLPIARQRAQDLATGQLRRRVPAGVKTVRQHGLVAVQQLALEENPVGREILFGSARRKLLEKTHGHYPAPLQAIEVMRYGYQKGFEQGLEREARLFGELACSEVSHRLVELYFSRNALKKDPGVADPNVKPRSVERVGVLGGGLMGSGIACVTIDAGLPVRIREQDDRAAARALAAVRRVLEGRVAKRSLSSLEVTDRLRLLTTGTGWEGFQAVDLVIEAVFENLSLKQEVLRAFETLNRDGIFASSTSSLPIVQIASVSKHPETVLGMHYFSPVHRVPLLEVIVTPRTAAEVTAAAVAVGKKQGKTVIVVGDGPGFFTSRVLAPYLSEAARLLQEGAAVEEVDRALVDFGFREGPFSLLDEMGIEVSEKAGRTLYQAFGERMAATEPLTNLVTAGRLGRKAGKGFYLYQDGKQTGVDPTVYDLLEIGRANQPIDRHEIAERTVLQMVNEAARCLGEGILRSARDGDVGAVLGLGFPSFRGGPFRWADSIGPVALLEKIERWRDRFGARFEPAPLLREQGKSGKRFY